MLTSFRPGLEALEDRCVPAVITVTKLSDGVGVPGQTLREAVAKANLTPANDKIVFKTGLKGTINLDPMLGHLDITTSMRIVGPGANKITISGQDAQRIFLVNDGTAEVINVTISKLTLTRGGARAILAATENLTLNRCTFSHNVTSGGGGGAVSTTGVLTVNKCRFFYSTANGGDGGAINCLGELTIRRSTFEGNRAMAGTGGAVACNADAVIEDCTFANNYAATDGGAVGTSGSGTLSMQRSTIRGNVSAGSGGGLSLSGSNALISASTISENVALSGEGGGVYMFNNELTLRNSTVSHNTAGSDGGGIFIFSESLTAQNCTIAYNQSAGEGGGIYAGVDVNLQSSIVARNHAVTAGPDLFSGVNSVFAGFSLIEDDSDAIIVPTPSEPNIIGQNPLLGPLQNNGGPTPTHALLPGSPAINAGSNPAGEAFDQRGPKFKRVKGIQADIGAFER